MHVLFDQVLNIICNAYLKINHLIFNNEHKSTLHNPTGEIITQILRQEFPKFRKHVRHLKFNYALIKIKHLNSFIIAYY